jgi:hypothetical protein
MNTCKAAAVNLSPGEPPDLFISSSTNSSSRQANQLDGCPLKVGYTHFCRLPHVFARLRPYRQPPDGPRATGPSSNPRRVVGHRLRRDGRDFAPEGTCRAREGFLSPFFRDGHPVGTHCTMFGTILSSPKDYLPYCAGAKVFPCRNCS